MPALQPLNVSVNAQNFIEFEPTGISNGLATYQGTHWVPEEGSTNGVVPASTAAALQPTLTISLQKPSKTSRISKTRVKMIIPQPVLDNGVATSAKDHESSIDLVIMSSEKSPVDERAQLLQFFTALLNDSTFQDVSVANKSIY